MDKKQAKFIREPGEHEAYYTLLIDLIRIVWEYHKRRIESGEEFAFAWDKLLDSSGVPVPAHLTFETGTGKPYPIIAYYARSVATSIKLSLHNFVELIGYETKGAIAVNKVLEKTLEPHGFSNFDYPRQLFQQAEELAMLTSAVEGKEGIVDILGRGASTGGLGSVQFAAIEGVMGEGFDALLASKTISKVDLMHISSELRRAGARYIQSNDQEEVVNKPKYDLLQRGTRAGLNMDELRELGHGEAFGCPAGRKPSKECIAYLQNDCGIVQVKRTVIDELAEMTRESFQREVVEWYGSLNPDQQKEYVDRFDRALLDKTLDLPRAPSLEMKCSYRTIERM